MCFYLKNRYHLICERNACLDIYALFVLHFMWHRANIPIQHTNVSCILYSQFHGRGFPKAGTTGSAPGSASAPNANAPTYVTHTSNSSNVSLALNAIPSACIQDNICCRSHGTLYPVGRGVCVWTNRNHFVYFFSIPFDRMSSTRARYTESSIN